MIMDIYCSYIELLENKQLKICGCFCTVTGAARLAAK